MSTQSPSTRRLTIRGSDAPRGAPSRVGATAPDPPPRRCPPPPPAPIAALEAAGPTRATPKPTLAPRSGASADQPVESRRLRGRATGARATRCARMRAHEPDRGRGMATETITVLFTDLVGSTELLSRVGEAR